MSRPVINKCKALASLVALVIIAQQAQAAIALDRTRIIYDGAQKSTSVSISNQNKTLPYLAQAWIEDEKGNKIQSPLTALPPLQRVEAGEKGQIKLQTTNALSALPQDRETIFYFNVREIPPKSSKPNTLQLALQTRVKIFYRPAAIEIPVGQENEAAKKLTLTRKGDYYQLNNPTPYYITIVSASGKGQLAGDFKPVMVAPKSTIDLGASASKLGEHPVLKFINDFGGRPQLTFNCQSNSCAVSDMKAG